MLRLFAVLAIAAALGACASVSPQASNDSPAMRALLAAPRGDTELAGLPFDMVQLLQARIGFELTAGDAAEITGATTQTLATGVPGSVFLWANQENDNRGEILLWRMDATGDGRVCGILHHEHIIANGTVRGSVTTCRRGAVDWWLDDWEWIITGADFGGL